MSLKISLSIILLALSFGLYGQTYTLNSGSNNTTVTTCSGTFFDSGGSANNYGNNQDYTMTFCSDNAGPIQFDFTYFETELNWDYLSIYDGTSTLSPPLAGSPFTNFDLEGETITSTAGCLTFNFDSDFSITRPGWEAQISCPILCQDIQGILTSISPLPNPVSGIIQLCQQGEVSYSAEGLYPENNLGYSQSDGTSTFEWSFGDGQTAIGTSVSHIYNDSGVYETTLLITDVNGCTSNNITEIIHVSTTPNFEGTTVLEDEICLGSENVLTGVVNPVIYTSDCENIDAEFVAIPDIQNQVHTSSVTLDCYGEGTTLDNIGDLEGICLNIEHSWVGDLSIEIICPNNQTVELLDFPNGGGGAYLGEPVDIEAQPNNAGVGYEYCFTNSPSYGDLASNLAGTTQPAGSYQSVEPLSGLLGCPLNGDWTISINDNIGADNGFLFYWALNLDPNLLVADGEFAPTILTGEWIVDPSITSTSGSSITVQPFTVGNSCYSYEVSDDFDCLYDTTLCFDVLESASSIIFDPVPTLCENEGIFNVTTNVSGGIWTGDVNSDGSFNPSVGQGSYFGILTLGSGTSCEISETVSIDVTAASTAVMSGSGSFCSGTTADIEINFTGTAPWSVDYSLDGVSQGELTTSNNPLIISVSTPGNYELLTLFDTNCTGTTSGSAIITESSVPVISNVLETCSGDLLSYIVSFDIAGGDISTYSVLEDGTILGSTFTSDPISNNANYTFTVSDVNNCGTDIINGSFNCGCAALASMSGDISICETGGIGNIPVLFEGAGPWTFNYSLDGISQETITTGDNPYSLEVTNLGIYELLTISDVNCEGTVAGIVEVSAFDIPMASNVLETCSSDLLTYTISFEIVGGDPSTYTILEGGTLVGNTFVSDPIDNYDSYTYTLSDGNLCGTEIISGTYDCGCAASGTISGDIDLCSNEFGFLQVDLIGFGPWNFEFSVDGVAQSAINTNESSFSLEVSAEGVYDLISVSDLYCQGDVFGTALVNALELPTANIFGNFEVCVGEEAQIPVDLTGAGPWNINYSINGVVQSDELSSSNNTFSFPSSQEGQYTLNMVSDVNCSNSGMGQATLNVHELPEAVIGGNLIICEDNPGVLVVNLVGSPGFELTYSVDGVIQEPLSTGELNQFEFFVEESGIYELLTIQDLYCSGIATGTTSVEVVPLPTALIEGSFIVCDGTEQPIPVTLTGDTEWSISYTINEVLQPSILTSDPNFSLAAVTEGEYIIIGVSDIYCSNEGDGWAILDYYPPIEVDYSDNIEVCVGESVDVWAIASGGFGEPYSYNWQENNLEIINDTLVSATLNQSGTISITVTDDCEYETATNIPLTIHQLPPVAINGLQSSCGPDFIQLYNTTPNNYVGNSCIWIINGDSVNDCSPSMEYYFPETGTYSIGLQLTSPEGCYNEEQFDDYIEVYSVPEANFHFTPEKPNIINPEVLFSNESIDMSTSTWTFSEEYQSFDTDPQFTFPSNNGPGSWNVCLSIENDFGCVDSICKIVNIESELLSHIPNSFTPDGDGLNDFFYPILQGVDAAEYEFSIYDRTGDLVFKTNDIQGKWNGSSKNNPDFYSKDGLYNWYIKARLMGSSEIRMIKGAVQVLR